MDFLHSDKYQMIRNHTQAMYNIGNYVEGNTMLNMYVQ